MFNDSDFLISGLTDRAAHAVRTPLAIILLELGRLGDPRAREIESLIEKFDRRLQSVLFLVELEEMRRRPAMPFDLGETLSEAVELNAALATERGVALQRNGVERMAALGHRDAALRALRHVIENAILHGASARSVRISLDPDGDVLVEDDGDGMTISPSERAFQLFVHGDSDDPGAGLGLSIARMAMRLHGGDCGVATSPEGGVSARLSFAASLA